MSGRRPISVLTPANLVTASRRLARNDRHLAGVLAALGTPPMWARPPGFATLVRIILEQQVTLASGAAAYARLSAGLGRVTPRSVLGRSHAQLMRLGLTRQKARYCRELADVIVQGRLDLPSLKSSPADAVRLELTAVTGIGRWTADVYLLCALRRADIWPRGDLALYESIRELTGGDGSPRELDSLADRWMPWRAVAARILWYSYLSRRGRL